MDDFQKRLDRLLGMRIAGCLKLLALDRLSGGASQETYRLRIQTAQGEKKLALRRAPPGAFSANVEGPGLAAEASLMRCAAAAGVPEPEIHYVLQPEDRLGEGFVMQWLDGETLGHRIVSNPVLDSIRPQLAYQCGRILARIHAIDIDATGLRQQLQTFSPETYVRFVWEQYQQLHTPQAMIDYTALWLLAHLPDSVGSTLVHNDFRNGNLMIGAQGITAVLDWETAHIGDPIRDLGWLCTNSWRFGRHDLPVGGFGEYEDLLQGYQDGSGRLVEAAHLQFWEVFGSFWWAVGCLRMAYQYRSGEDSSIERPAIGRRSSEAQIDCVNRLIPGEVRLAEDCGASED
jgi:aminoglycoside phosphotransferase (APT) family kinase protein